MASNVARGLRVFVWAGLSVLVVIALDVAASHVLQLARALEVAWLPATLVLVVHGHPQHSESQLTLSH